MKLFVIEGIDGAGKSTQIRLLREFFSGSGYRNEFLHFPRTDAPYFGELIARFLRGEFGTLGEVNPYLVAMLYAGDRKDASDMIKGWLNEKKIVFLDRYTYSNIAYQCAKLADANLQDALKDWILALEFDHFRIPKPDLNIFLDVPFSFTEKKLTAARSGNDREYLNGIKDIHEENLAFQRRVREMYVRVSKTDNRLALINCSDEKGEMLPQDKIFNAVLKLLKERNLL
ncbi:MAG TPA: dTMP kinase [Bacteroidales bacterium]|jgi:dTMP kinase|nr:dTMP kinase [Bacteroidales bacterium]